MLLFDRSRAGQVVVIAGTAEHSTTVVNGMPVTRVARVYALFEVVIYLITWQVGRVLCPKKGASERVQRSLL